MGRGGGWGWAWWERWGEELQMPPAAAWLRREMRGRGDGGGLLGGWEEGPIGLNPRARSQVSKVSRSDLILAAQRARAAGPPFLPPPPGASRPRALSDAEG